MKPATKYHCEVCGAAQKSDGWFLIAEDSDQNTLQILKWNNQLADRPGMRHLCSAAHVEELVSHWMVGDGLDYAWRTGNASPDPAGEAVDASYRLGELTLDRASFAALGERPDMMNSILEAIDGALQAAAATRSLLEEQEEEESAPVYDA